MNKIREILEKININGSIYYNLPMSRFTTFKTGGPADVVISPVDNESLIKIIAAAKQSNIPLFVLGGGANLLVSDRGIRGIVLNTRALNGIDLKENRFYVKAGSEVSLVCQGALDKGLSGLEFIYGMPGTMGGALWMNARCYGKSISEIIDSVSFINKYGEPEIYRFKKEDWEYKKSPFQKNHGIITGCTLNLIKKDSQDILIEMNKNKKDRENKGHFVAPCAGSVFKNNRLFGKPSGLIIEEVGLKGLSQGGACVSDFHANIIINKGKATSSDILSLIKTIQKQVYKKTAYLLEPEIQLAGDWEVTNERLSRQP